MGEDPEGDPPDCAFNCASVIGMLWCLHGHSRPDLGMAASQEAAQFSFAPKRNHASRLSKIVVANNIEDVDFDCSKLTTSACSISRSSLQARRDM